MTLLCKSAQLLLLSKSTHPWQTNTNTIELGSIDTGLNKAKEGRKQQHSNHPFIVLNCPLGSCGLVPCYGPQKHRSNTHTDEYVKMLMDWLKAECVSQGPRQVFAGNWFLPPPSNFSCSSSTQEHSCPCMTVSHKWNLIYSNQLNKRRSSFFLTEASWKRLLHETGCFHSG